MAEEQRQLTIESARVSKSQAIAAFSLVEMDKDPELSLILTTYSVKKDYLAGKDIPSLSESVFRQAVLNSRIRAALTGHDDAVWDTVYSPDGDKIVTASEDKTAKVWDAATGQELSTLTGQLQDVFDLPTAFWSADYSPDGQRIATE